MAAETVYVSFTGVIKAESKMVHKSLFLRKMCLSAFGEKLIESVSKIKSVRERRKEISA